ncbi:MAG: nickel pincer cofactor biosynthesis protein LarC [Desulfobaccales bacterium]
MSTEPQTERWAFFDCFAGISGDMTLGALMDLGLTVAELQEVLAALGLKGVAVAAHRVTKEHLTGLKVEITGGERQPARTYRDITAMISQAPLSDAVKALSLEMFRLLGEVEARIHGQSLETVHFHELGGLDSIVDIVGVAYGLERLGVSRVFCSPLPMGWGMIAAGHGRLPNPAPATLELLKGLPVYGTDLPGELVTPTGAVILKALKAECQPCPPLTLTGVGYGAGSRDLPGHPNLLRLYLGTPLASASGHRETVLVLETHLDDMNPEWFEPLMQGLFRDGALDVALTPLQMKKGRPGVALTVIAPLAAKEGLLARIFTDSTTLGVRVLEVERVTARRWSETLETPYGPLEVKVMAYGGRRRVLPEYEACRRLAEAQGVPLIEIYRLIPRE